MTLQLDSVELVTDMTFNIIGGGVGGKHKQMVNVTIMEPGTKFNLEHGVSTLLLSVFGVRFAGAAEHLRCLTGLRTSSEFSQ